MSSRGGSVTARGLRTYDGRDVRELGPLRVPPAVGGPGRIAAPARPVRLRPRPRRPDRRALAGPESAGGRPGDRPAAGPALAVADDERLPVPPDLREPVAPGDRPAVPVGPRGRGRPT